MMYLGTSGVELCQNLGFPLEGQFPKSPMASSGHVTGTLICYPLQKGFY